MSVQLFAVIVTFSTLRKPNGAKAAVTVSLAPVQAASACVQS